MKKLTTDSLDSLFEHLNQPETIFWIRDKSYKKQIYVNSAIETVWGIPTAKFYDDSDGKMLKATMLPDEGRDKWLTLDKVKNSIANKEVIHEQHHVNSPDVLLRIKDTHGEEKYLLDSHFQLVDQHGEHVGFTGIVQTLSKDEWFAKYYAEKSQSNCDSHSALKRHVFDLLYKEAGLTASISMDQKTLEHIPRYYIIQAGKEVTFTKRESQCIYYLQQGKSAKQTAELIHTSSRTVEYHIGNACEKANTHSKIELLTRIKLKA